MDMATRLDSTLAETIDGHLFQAYIKLYKRWRVGDKYSWGLGTVSRPGWDKLDWLHLNFEKTTV